EEKSKGDLTLFGCNVNNIDEFIDGRENGNLSIQRSFKDYLANTIADIIINDLEGVLINEIVQNQCQDYSQKEKKLIYDSALKKLNNLKEKEEDSILSQVNQKSRIQLELIDYLDINNEIILEGFIRFRLKDYFTELKLAVECAIDDFMLEKEYEEFITLLRYFVDIQEPQVHLVHVVRDAKSGFKLLDKDYERIENEYLEGFVLDMVDDELHYEDLLISALITVAPERIKLHCDKNDKVVETVENIFEDKAVVCSGCEYCQEVKSDQVFEYER
ncbi:MAG: Sporulation protein YtxC, partial [Candidatus Frackibacter sp. T328-2]